MIFSEKILARIRYPDDWDRIRKEVLARDEGRCHECGIENTEIHVHHVVSLSRGGSNEFTNLVSLCRKCHMKQHGHMRFADWSGDNKGASFMLRACFALITASFVLLLISK